MAQVKWYQRRWLINNKLQVAVLLYAAIFALWVTMINYMLVAAFSGQFGAIPQYVEFILFPLLLFVLTLSTVAFGLVLTNRIAGPMHRLKMHMDKVAEGQPVDDLKLREADFFFEVAESYNRLLKRLK